VGVREQYNTDAAFVRQQYQDDPSVLVHVANIPECFPLSGLGRLAFVHLNTGNTIAEAASLPYLYACLSVGGFILIDKYAISHGYRADYDLTLARIGASIWTLPTGQGVIRA
jgi:hypothetical protein